jgi:hypothetical protein
MAGMAAQVTEVEEIERLNRGIAGRYPEQAIFAPCEASCAVLRITLKLVSIIDLARAPGLPQLVAGDERDLRPPDRHGSGPGGHEGRPRTSGSRGLAVAHLEGRRRFDP